MPIYQYQCDECDLRFERRQSFSESPLTQCPRCRGRVRRLIQPVGVVFKGSGFYVTDNRQVSSPTLKPPKDEKPAEAAAGEGTAPKAPATPAQEKREP